MVKKTCKSCKCTNTLRWRGDVCNSCGLRKRSNNNNGFEGSNPNFASSSVNDPPLQKQKKVCENCGSTTTKKWRSNICNICYNSCQRKEQEKAAMFDAVEDVEADEPCQFEENGSNGEGTGLNAAILSGNDPPGENVEADEPCQTEENVL